MGKITLDHPQLFIQAFENSAIGMALIAASGELLKVNQALCCILGYEEHEMLKLKIFDITHPDDSENDLHIVHLLLDGKEHSYHSERRYIHKDGYEIWALMSVSLVRDEQQTPFFISVKSRIFLTEGEQRKSCVKGKIGTIAL